MDFYSGKGVVRGRRGQQLGFAWSRALFGLQHMPPFWPEEPIMNGMGVTLYYYFGLWWRATLKTLNRAMLQTVIEWPCMEMGFLVRDWNAMSGLGVGRTLLPE